jgi:isochorismate synthase/2-succinyl-5-enolpyruvyl-6-hydroxy-3-cyclohexene-1-carboxylate synthase/2-succinyl-6-hydroxy-2,4-cyclohexadiene-1-carboxylate synthase/O-succinylbenzoate synthase
LSLAAYTQFSSYLEIQRLSTFKLFDVKPAPSVAHGLGTYSWLKEDITPNPLLVGHNPHSGLVEASVENASRLLSNFQVDQDVVCNTIDEEKVCRYQVNVEHNNLSCSFEVCETGLKTNVSKEVSLHISKLHLVC